MNSIQGELKNTLKDRGFSDVEILEVPLQGDHGVRLQTINEILSEIDSSPNSETIQYIVRAKKSETTSIQKTNDEIHLPDGKLNGSFLLKNANILLAAKDTGAARAIFKALIKGGVSIPESLIGLSMCDEIDGRLGDAIEKLQHAITYEPHAEAYQRLIQIERSRGNYERAGEIISKAFRSTGLESKTQSSLHPVAIEIWKNLGRYDLVESHCESILDINPNDIPVRVNLIRALIHEGQVKDAERNIQEILRRIPGHAESLGILGSIKLQGGDVQSAYELLVKSLEAQTANPTAIIELVRCAYQLKKYSKAAEILQKFIDTNPVHPDLLYSLAGLYFHLGRFTEAKKLATQVLDMKSGHLGSQQLLKLIEKVA